jgi:acetylglutamate kinase
MDLENISPQDKARVLLEALPYLQRFKESIFVVKYGGSFMDDPDPEQRSRVAVDIAFLAAAGIRVVVVHGGGKRISRALAEAGIESRFEQGLRVTTAPAIKIVQKTLSFEINRGVCDTLRAVGGNPRGIPGEVVLRCEPRQAMVDGEPRDLGFVGSMTEVATGLIEDALIAGKTPVISPLASGEDGDPYNVNADEAAAHVAIALSARRLVFMSDVPGLLNNPEDPESLISSLPVARVPALIGNGTIATGMLPKVESAVRAIESGVSRVHFVDGRLPHSILLEIFTDEGIGTEIVQT